MKLFDAAFLQRFEARYGQDASHRLERWQAMLAEVAGRETSDKLEAVNSFFNRIPWLSDEEHWGKRDYWATPLEMLGTNGGDCEDYSIAKYISLRKLGFADEQLRITYVRARTLRQTHMVLAYYKSPDAEPLILDNLDPTIRLAGQRGDLQPVYSFNGSGLWAAVKRGQGERIGDPGRLAMWRDVTSRMNLTELGLR
ncbi:MAG: transglutaminase-like cysteine peptidase [Gammaproteobacteria bacterium]|nr:transglutaminase-like cysteine peptidase [Gammaproteobacteria bacterium]